MTHRGQITNRWTRLCIDCGNRVHINALRTDGQCSQCGGGRWTRDRTKVEA